MIAVIASDEASGGSALFCEFHHDFIATQNARAVGGASEISIVGDAGYEAVGFVHEAGNRNSRHVFPPILVSNGYLEPITHRDTDTAPTRRSKHGGYHHYWR